VVGEVLFWSIKECIGEVAYTRETHRVWCKIISRMMFTMLPIAVAFELKFGASVNHRGRLQAHNSLHAESIEESKNKREKTERGGNIEPNTEAMIKINNETVTKSLKASNKQPAAN
jgi:hypothetical protein